MRSIFRARRCDTGLRVISRLRCETIRARLEQDHTFYPGWLGQVMMLIELGELKEADGLGG